MEEQQSYSSTHSTKPYDEITKEQWTDGLGNMVNDQPEKDDIIEKEAAIPPEIVKLKTEEPARKISCYIKTSVRLHKISVTLDKDSDFRTRLCKQCQHRTRTIFEEAVFTENMRSFTKEVLQSAPTATYKSKDLSKKLKHEWKTCHDCVLIIADLKRIIKNVIILYSKELWETHQVSENSVNKESKNIKKET